MVRVVWDLLALAPPHFAAMVGVALGEDRGSVDVPGTDFEPEPPIGRHEGVT